MLSIAFSAVSYHVVLMGFAMAHLHAAVLLQHSVVHHDDTDSHTGMLLGIAFTSTLDSHTGMQLGLAFTFASCAAVVFCCRMLCVTRTPCQY